MNKKRYQLVKKIHLYASLTTVVFFSMYLVSGFVLMQHQDTNQGVLVLKEDIKVSPDILENNNWSVFMKEHDIHGKKIFEQTDAKGRLQQNYKSPGQEIRLSVSADTNWINLEVEHKSLNGYLVDLHKQKGFDGPPIYQLYAVFVDVMALSLLVFVVSGVLLWLQVVPKIKVGLAVLFLGACYIGTVVVLLMTG